MVEGKARSARSKTSDIRVEVREPSQEKHPAPGILTRILTWLFGGDAVPDKRRVRTSRITGGAKEPEFNVTVGAQAIGELIAERQHAQTRIYETLTKVSEDLKVFFPNVPEVFAARVTGRLLNLDGTPARNVSVEALEPQYAGDEDVRRQGLPVAWPTPRALTDDRGVFGLLMPRAPVPEGGLRFVVRGGNTATEFGARRIELADGKLGRILLDVTLMPLPRSIVSRLGDIVPTSAGDVEESPEEFAQPAPVVTLGSGDCAYSFRSNSGVIDKFRYSMLVRLIEPQVAPRQLAARQWMDDKSATVPLPLWDKSLGTQPDKKDVLGVVLGSAQFALVERLPVDRPIDVTEFRESIEEDAASVPKASSLGLGYVVKMHQLWIPVGLSLGDMLYALPLAPGEQQRVAVYEKAETLSVRDAESLSFDEAQRFRESADTSTLAVFESTLKERVRGHSDMHTDASTWGVGGAGGIGGFGEGILGGIGVAGGYGSASTSGDTNSWQRASRDFTSIASQEFHSDLSRQAAASRRSSRTGVRLASASEREQVTTKVITNHNHCHALTVQYWEVLRHFSVSSQVDDIQLVCFVPVEVVQFLPPGQSRTITGFDYERRDLLERYEMLIRYRDVIAGRLRRPEHRHGLKLLEDFVSNPTTTVQSSSGSAQDVVGFSVRGTFLPFEDMYVSAVTKGGARIGPLKLGGASTAVPSDSYSTREELLTALRERRAADAGETRTASLALPSYVARTDIARFELTRSFRPFTYRLARPGEVPSFLEAMQWLAQSDAVFSAAQLEQLFGGPYIWDVSAIIFGTNVTYVNAFAGRAAAELMPTLLPVPTLRVPPVLSFTDLLRIEATLQHVVQNTVTYSKAVWMSLTPEERAILLERFTIGVPEGGLPDASQEVPLLNCVANEVLGYFGNALIMPFYIPPPLAASMGVTSRDVQEALLKFHRQGFVPPQSSITLPTRGMLGEAVLGACTSCEKIDLTRFWNWKDSESELDKAADAARPSDFKGQSLVGTNGAQAPTSLVPTSPVNLLSISTGQNVPALSSTLLEQMIKQLPDPTAFKDLTGTDALKSVLENTLKSAGEARKESVDTSKAIVEKIIGGLPELVKAQAGIDEAALKEKQEKEKAAAEKKKEVVSNLSSNATSYIGLAGAQADDTKAQTVAQALVGSLFRDGSPSFAELATLFEKYKVAQNDDAVMKRGKEAMLKSLGLLAS